MNLAKPEKVLKQLRDRNLLKLFFTTFLGLGLFFIIPKYAVAFLLISLTLAVAILSKRYEINKAGVEISTFTTIILGAAFNPETGALLGFITILLQVLTGSGGAYILWVVPGYVAAGYIAGVLGPQNIVFNGIALCIGMQAFFGLGTALFSPGYLAKFVPRAAAAIVFNAVIFQMAAQPVLSVMT